VPLASHRTTDRRGSRAVTGVDRDRVATDLGTRGTTAQAGLTDPATLNRVIATVIERHRIDAPVNNTGGLHVRTSLLDMPTSKRAMPGMSKIKIPIPKLAIKP
jgi:NAD(P)-dependent dehydrogenase (short-subunit alcohol dehydrogenase family)